MKKIILILIILIILIFGYFYIQKQADITGPGTQINPSENTFYIKYDVIDDDPYSMPQIENQAVYKNNEELVFYVKDLNLNYNSIKLIDFNEKDNYLYAFTTNIGWDYHTFIVIDLGTIEIIKQIPTEMEGEFISEFNKNYSKVTLKTELKTITLDL